MAFTSSLTCSVMRALASVEDLENFGGGNDKIYEHKLCIILKFRMFMINVLTSLNAHFL